MATTAQYTASVIDSPPQSLVGGGFSIRVVFTNGTRTVQLVWVGTDPGDLMNWCLQQAEALEAQDAAGSVNSFPSGNLTFR